ncbi:MAG TPA: hypothetical protein VGF58_03560 [Burkholderiales bacterium]
MVVLVRLVDSEVVAHHIQEWVHRKRDACLPVIVSNVEHGLVRAWSEALLQRRVLEQPAWPDLTACDDRIPPTKLDAHA